jgi:hypothetical protein
MFYLIIGSPIHAAFLPPHNVTQAIKGLTSVQKASGLHLGQDAGYLKFFHSFSQSLQANIGVVCLLRPHLLPSASFPVYYSLILPFDTKLSDY